MGWKNQKPWGGTHGRPHTGGGEQVFRPAGLAVGIMEPELHQSFRIVTSTPHHSPQKAQGLSDQSALCLLQLRAE